MKFQGRVKKMLPLRSGVSQRTGNEWKALPFIFEYFENPTDHYPESVVLETYDTKVIEGLKEGMEIVVGFGHRTREFEGRWYNELRIYSLESVARAQNAAPQAAKPIEPSNNPPGFERPATDDGNGDNDDLPF
jgi:hypothetical protein